MSDYRKMVLVENGEMVVIQDSNGLAVSFDSFEDCFKYTGHDFTGRFYIGYEPELPFFQDSKKPLLDAGDIPHQPYEDLIANIQTYLNRKANPFHGMNDIDKKTSLLANLSDAVDSKTDVLIETGWVYPSTNGQKIRLSALDQANYEGEKNLYAELDYDGVAIAGYFPLDIKVWTGSNGEPIMLTIEDLAAYKTFNRAGKGHIRSKLQEGWSLKNQLTAMTLAELENWEDTR